ncbi:MAG: insulinase family protein [Calditrichaeota bacterium]|nr:MAG: insulinase family protein [Calditrichota bacterium]
MRPMMILLRILILVALPLWGVPPGEQFFPYRYETVKLPNNFTAILIPIHGSGLVAYYTIVRTGSRDEYEPGKSGFAHFFEHMMFRGTKKFPAEVYDRLVTEMGADANAYTTDDYTCYYMVLSRENLEQAMELESDRFQNLSYDEEAFRTEAGAVYGEFRKNRTSPWSIAYEAVCNTAFRKHTYRHTTIGFEEDIKNMPNLYDFSKTFFDRYYRPENCVLLLVGDFDPEMAREMINKYYGNWQPGYVPPKIPVEPPQKAERVREVRYEGRTLPIIWVAYKGAAFDPNYPPVAAAFLLGQLAFGENSEIYKKLVIREQKVQFIEGEFGFNRDPKFYSVITMVKNEEDIPYVLQEIDRAARKFREEPVSQEELDKIKRRVRYQFLMELDTPGNIAANLARFIALTGNLDDLNTLYETLAKLTPADIQQAANAFLQKEKRTVIIVKGSK